jgi:hypothetical protein
VASDPVISRLITALAADAPRALRAIRAARAAARVRGLGPGRHRRAGSRRRPGHGRHRRDHRDRPLDKERAAPTWNLVFTPLQVLPDGSFLPVMPTPAENVRLGQARASGRVPPGLPEGHIVRIIEYTVTVRAAGGTTRIEAFRLATTLLDHQRAPAAGLAALYHERRESENGYAELKTRLRGAAFILRSRSPELVRQELFAFLTACQALCALEAEAARQAGIDPDRISFTVTVRVARDHAASPAIITRHSLDLARRQAISDLLSDTLPHRRDRHYERVRKQPKNNFPAMKRGQERRPSRVTYKIKVTRKTQLPAQTP